MSRSESVRRQVQQFFAEVGVNECGRVEHAFGPWYLHKKFKLPTGEALPQCSDGSHDGGIDAFVITRTDNVVTLTLIQSKLSESYNQVCSALEDLIRGIQTTQNILKTGDTFQADENRVIRNLRRELMNLAESERETLQLRCLAVSLNSEDRELLRNKSRIQELEREFGKQASRLGFGSRIELDYVGPEQMIFSALAVPAASRALELDFQGTEVSLTGARCQFGLASLDGLVDLYDRYRADLFAHNVRMFLYRRAKKEQGVSNQIRRSLEQICGMAPNRDGLTVDHFPVMHNGITLWAEGLQLKSEGRIALDPGMRGIFILNGCQTVYTAWKLREDLMQQTKVDWRAAWSKIKIPLRIVVSDDHALVQRVTVSTNRQNQIGTSAFWAHHPAQLRLEEGLRRLRVFYERQEGAYEHRSRLDLKRMQEDYRNTDEPITLEEAAQLIAIVDPRIPLSSGTGYQKIFESESLYQRVFSERNTQASAALIFCFNAFRALRLVLKDLQREVSEGNPLKWSKPSQLAIPGFRLLTQYLLKEVSIEELVPFSARTFSARTAEMRDLKDNVRRWLRFNNSGIEQALREHWYRKGQDGEVRWQSYTETDVIEAALRSLKLPGASPFEGWKALDELVVEYQREAAEGAA